MRFHKIAVQTTPAKMAAITAWVAFPTTHQRMLRPLPSRAAAVWHRTLHPPQAVQAEAVIKLTASFCKRGVRENSSSPPVRAAPTAPPKEATGRERT